MCGYFTSCASVICHLTRIELCPPPPSSDNMADIFTTENARKLLHNKFILLLGDSNMRATYKDLILLINRNELMSLGRLRKRGEDSFEGDRRIVFSGLTRGRQYEEGREFARFDTHLEYHFITRCYNPKIEMLLNKMKSGEMKAPDVIIMNSCVWDITRWGPNGVDTYKENMHKLMYLLEECLPRSTLFIWTTALPVSAEMRSGLLIKQLDFMQSLFRFEVMEANLFCHHLVVSHGYDVLDTHYHLRMQVHRRLQDGIHYGPLPVRFITNLLLTHMSLSRSVPLPGNFTGVAIEKNIKNSVLYSAVRKNVYLPSLPVALRDGNHQITSRKKAKCRNRNNFPGRSMYRMDEVVWQMNDASVDIRAEEAVTISRCPLPQSHLHDNESTTACSEQKAGHSNHPSCNNPGIGPIRNVNKFATVRQQHY